MKWLLLALSLLASPALAVQPDEILSDPVLEARAREISVIRRVGVLAVTGLDFPHYGVE